MFPALTPEEHLAHVARNEDRADHLTILQRRDHARTSANAEGVTLTSRRARQIALRAVAAWLGRETRSQYLNDAVREYARDFDLGPADLALVLDLAAVSSVALRGLFPEN